jgi:lipopolysaccharide biosynthesis regulator YciM
VTYIARGQTKEAAVLHEKVLDSARRRTLDKEHPHTLSCMYNLAAAYWSSGLYNRAIEPYERELDVCRKVHGAQHPETLMSIQNLAYRYLDIGRTNEAALPESSLREFVLNYSP